MVRCCSTPEATKGNRVASDADYNGAVSKTARPIAQPRSARTRRQFETPKSRAVESIKSVLEQQCDIEAVAFTFVWLDDQGKAGFYDSHPLDAQALDVSNVTGEDVQQRLRAAYLRSSEGASVLSKKRLRFTPDNSDCLPKRRRHSPENAADQCSEGRQQCMQETTVYPISDKNMVAQHMKTICNRLYQCTSKFICKDLIQEIEPQKQKTYPYLTKKRNGAKSDRSCVMPFWPSLDECRYMEPDRLWSLERTLLKVSIIRWPHKDPEEFAKFVAQGILRGFSSWIDMLEDATSNSCRKSFQANRPGCEEVIKAQEAHLAELFRVARLERDYHEGGVGA
ncbi:hypothetical protein B0A49_00017 [Cryomyces minteri]|uniref:Subtelomeric hrmA-associated cluster protein AFUB-079030/YDR124W-like helical bundle domain-containing protein n=1 Tax=Cryomyces minteri TaxID=331657 RepID=A0A4U0Y232_9PEZI|nr:hypothetical protein B0A49_00017 [Cryomyces minteri]